MNQDGAEPQIEGPDNPPDGRFLELSVLIPAYNEESVIQENLREVAVIVEKFANNFEIIIVDDGSCDNTFEEALSAAGKDSRIKAVQLSSNRGKGYALKAGFQESEGEKVAFLDADLDLSPEQIEDFISVMDEAGADVGVGSKRHSGSLVDYPWARKVLSRTYSFLVRLMFGLSVRDTQTGLKVYRREVLCDAFPLMRCERFAFDLELLALASQHGYQLIEIPVKLRFSREKSFRRIRPKDFLQAGMDTLAIFLRLQLGRFFRKPPKGPQK